MTDPALAIAVPLIAEFEGFSATPYADVGGVWTIGYGETYDLAGNPITAHTSPITRAEAMTRLSVLVSTYLGKVRAMVHVPITDNQAAALTSFAYNEGTGALRGSGLMLALNQGRVQEAADAFRAWVYAGGRPNNGLQARREKERALFLTAAVMPPTPREMTPDELMDLYNPAAE